MTQHIFKDAASNVQDLTARKFRQATNVVDSYISSNPWRSVGIAATIGVLIGILTARR